MQYPEWAPPRLVKDAENERKQHDIGISLDKEPPLMMADRLCTHPKMKRAWRTLSQNNRGQGYEQRLCTYSYVAAATSYRLNSSSANPPLPGRDLIDRYERIAKLADELAKLTANTRLDNPNGLFDNQMHKWWQSTRETPGADLMLRAQTMLQNLAHAAQNNAVAEQKFLDKFLPRPGVNNPGRLFCIRYLAEQYFIPECGKYMYRTLAAVASTILDDDTIDETVAREALRKSDSQPEIW